jgi:ankyrin repeat protein
LKKSRIIPTRLRTTMNNAERKPHYFPSVEEETMNLLQAALDGQAEECHRLLADGADVNVLEYDNKDMPLHYAAVNGHVEICRMLIEAGATLDARNTYQVTPLLTAAYYGHVEVCRILIEAGAAVEAKDDTQATSLHAAAQIGHAEVCRMLMEAGAVVDARQRTQHTPLHLAAANGQVEICRILMEAGAAIDASSDQQCTPLHFAAFTGHTEICCVLTEAKAAVDARNSNQRTPLHLAALNDHDSTCILLTFAGADLHARASTNQTPAEIAQSKGHDALAVHLRYSNGAHCLRCMGPSLERRLLWNDTTQQQQDVMLDEMQAQWLARVAEGCAHARVGLTLRGAFGGGLSTSMLMHVMGYVFGGTQVHLQSCISTERMTAAAACSAIEGDVPAVSVAENVVLAAERVELGGQQQLLPKLALVSHALALAATPAPQPQVMCVEARQQLQATLARLSAAAKAGEGGCEWLLANCDFLQRRHRLGS